MADFSLEEIIAMRRIAKATKEFFKLPGVAERFEKWQKERSENVERKS